MRHFIPQKLSCLMFSILLLSYFPTQATDSTTSPSDSLIIPHEDLVAVHYFYSYDLNDFYYTISKLETDNMIESYLNNETTYEYLGVAGYAYETSKEDTIPVYRFFNKRTADHFYTISEEEKTSVEADYENLHDNYQYEGIAWYVPTWSSTPVYRFFDPIDFSHYYTSDENEKYYISNGYQKRENNYRSEGIGWYWYTENEHLSY